MAIKDEDVLKKNGVNDFTKYRFVKDANIKEEDLMVDFFL